MPVNETNSSTSPAARSPARLVYPQLPERLAPADLHRLVSPSYHERQWVPTIARTPASQAALLVQLKIFQCVGRFLGTEDIPAIIVEHIASQVGVSSDLYRTQSERTLYRHRPAILKFLGVTPWGADARKLAESTMMKLASARTDPADLINAAIDILVQSHFELPALIALRRIAGTVDINILCHRTSAYERGPTI